MAKEKLQLAGKNVNDLLADLAGFENEYQQMKFDHAVKGLGNPMELREMRRNIARVQTELRQRELAAMSPEQIELRSKIRARRSRQK
jgi:large subunit ribosomal protein L29